MISIQHEVERQEVMWKPTATLENLRQRANLIAKIRQFFAERDVLEVETPVMSHSTVTDPYVVGIPALFSAMGETQERVLYLQTSPEYAMKRLLAAGSGSIYQINKAFRQGEIGIYHNPEFSILEWYRPGFDHHALMSEMDDLLQLILKTPPAERLSYAELFERQLGFNPHYATPDVLAACAKQQKIVISSPVVERDVWLDLLWTHCIEPVVGQERPIFLYDFPASQAALAKVRDEEPAVASRFEVYFKGIELANGFHELQDAKEQASRFNKDLAYRARHGLAERPIDQRFLAALEYGLPDCSGVALGIDRLMLLALNCERVSEVLSFAFEVA